MNRCGMTKNIEKISRKTAKMPKQDRHVLPGHCADEVISWTRKYVATGVNKR
jgi:hypothetical protein